MRLTGRLFRAARALDPWLVAALSLSLLAAAPLYVSQGFLNTRAGGDSPFLLFRLYELSDSLRAGIFPVRWMPHAAYGYGFPFFDFYAAFPFYLAALLRLTGFGFVGALKAVQALGFIAAAAGMYAWSQRVLGARPAACVAAVAYTFAPFHLVNVYVRGDSLSEFYAFAWYPWILLALDRLVERPTARRAAALALAYGGLLMTHNISALIFTPFVALYGLVLILTPSLPLAWRLRQERGIGAEDQGRVLPIPTRARRYAAPVMAAVGAGLLGLALGAWVWLPALGEGRFVHLEVQTTGYFNYAEHFRGLDLVQPELAFQYGGVGGGVSPFAMGLVQALLVVAGALALAWQAALTRNVRGGFALAALVLATFMITPWSQPLYDHVPLLPFVQFPWRFLSVQSLWGAVAVGAMWAGGERGAAGSGHEAEGNRQEAGGRGQAGSGEPRVRPGEPIVAATPALRSGQALRGRPALRGRRGLARPLASVVAAALLAVALIAPQLMALPLDFLTVGDADVTPERLQLYELFTGNIGTTIRAEYLPQWVVPRPYTSGRLVYGEPDVAKLLAGEGQAERAWERPDAQGWRVEAGPAGASIAFPTYYFPGWGARVDGQPVPVRPLDGLGWITLDVPAGAHDVALQLERTPLRAAAEALSLAALVVLGMLGTWPRGGFPRKGIFTAEAQRARGGPQRFLGEILGGSVRDLRASAVKKGTLTTLAFVTLALVATLVLQPSLPPMRDDDLTWDFSVQPYLAHGAVHFANGVELTSYRYSAESVNASDYLTMTLEWANPNGQPFESLVSMDMAGQEFPALDGLVCCGEGFSGLGVDGDPNSRYGFTPDEFLSPGYHFIAVDVFGQPVGPLGPSGSPGPPGPRLSAFSSSGIERGRIYLRPVFVHPSDEPPSPIACGHRIHTTCGNPVQAHLGPVTLAFAGEPGVFWTYKALHTSLFWRPDADLAANYGLSLRLSDINGVEWATRDTLAGNNGFTPSALWHPGALVLDETVLPIPDGTPPGKAYTLTITLYDIRTLEPLGSASLPSAWYFATGKPNLSLITRVWGLGLHRLDVPATIQQGETIPLTAHWSVAAPLAALSARWTLVAPDGREAYTLDTPLAPGSDPTEWPLDAYVLGRHLLVPPADLTPGAYTLRLTIINADSTPLGTYDAPQPITVAVRPRLFDVPPLAVTLDADYGGLIRLHGYTLERSGAQLRLTLAWGALAAPGHDYKVFVHLFNPADEAIVTQHDAPPREGAYPTSQWVQGEVVTDTVTLDLSQVPPGRYQLAVGLYDDTGRLGERVVLPQEVGVP